MQSPIDKIRGMLGLCAKAGKVASGAESCEIAVRKGQAKLVLIDSGASQATKKSALDACRFRNIEFRELPAGIIESAIGKPGRVAAAITHEGFAASLISLLDQQRDRGGVCSQ